MQGSSNFLMRLRILKGYSDFGDDLCEDYGEDSVLQFLAGINPDFEYARIHLLDMTHFPTLEETHTYCLSDQSRRSPMSLISGSL
ncbi:hypothetical protein GIB67_040843 [Kingdonia uniflora]|uniref:Uncharacterized protein n=1 Tax=Kingdonia uniflora TaxID=39325 RepID=A0A7J7P4T8_9MAGN|nr:hypothetical protein GIB67_040843 [Kingdonia uniflora]